MFMLQLRRRRRRRLFLCVVEVACLVSNLFFVCSICNINSHGIQTTVPFLINMLTVFLMWLIVVLLLLQTMQHRHRCCFAFFFAKNKFPV